MSRETNCVVLLSGGLDSTVMLYWIKERYDKVFPLYINYGSSHMANEFCAAITTCKDLKLDLETVIITGSIFSGSSLTNKEVKTPDDLKDTINVVVPFRNLNMISLAASYADKVDAGVIAISPTAEDREVFRDCRREFYDALEVSLKYGSKYEQTYQILTPFINNTKEDIVRIGVDLDVDFSNTWSCYNPQDNIPCKVCPACIVREKGFKLAGIKDPLIKEKVIK
jgi:7-cyano-7-deazaguanine synthase